MKRFLTILSIPVVLAGVLFWSAAVMLKVAVLTLFSRSAKRRVVLRKKEGAENRASDRQRGSREIRIKPNAFLYNHG